MENILKKPYEISIWEDYTSDENKKYHQERKLMIIGSDKMTAPLRAIKPIFKENVNGTHTLTFSLYTKYFDEDVGDFIDNPFLPYMVNERKVKLKYDNKWYDFVIKEIEEDSLEKSFNYTLTDSFINELSKNGFSIELDTELENNQGTIGELSETILKGTDWKVGHVDTLVQKNVEALYAVKIPSGTSIVGTDMSTLLNENPKTITITSKPNLTGTEVEPIIYVFYSSAMDNTIPMQFLYREDGKYTIDEDGVINNAPNYLLTNGKINVNTSNGATNDFRGNRIVQKEITKYDSTTDHFVTLYEDSNKEELYMYYDNEYISPTLVSNYVANSVNFVSTDGWTAPSPLTIKNIIYPFMYDIEDYASTNFVSYMRIKYNEAKPVYNSGIISNASYFNKGIAEGEEYVLRLKYGINTDEKGKPAKDFSNKLRAKVAKYTLDTDGNYNFDGNDEVFSFITSTPIFESEVDKESGLSYVYYVARAKQSVSYSDIKSTKNPIGLFFSLSTPDNSNYYFIQDAQFFPYKLDYKDNIVFPGSTPEACVKKKYFYYYPKQIKEINTTLDLVKRQIMSSINSISSDTADELVQIFKDELIKTGIVGLAIKALNNEVKKRFGDINFDASNFRLGPLKNGDDINSILYAYIGNEKSPNYTVKYDKTFEKIRSITEKESNRFNLIQTLCETFECWPQFVIKHEENGAISIDENGPKKTINFYEYVGKDNYSGFKYGINLKSIKRSLDSEQIVSKIIVKPNSNEYAQDGFCSIARASENPIKENFLINFRYYIQQGLLDSNEVTNDLYLYIEGGKYLGYYIRLNKINKQYDNYILEYSLIGTELDNLNAAYTSFKTAYDEAIKQINEAKNTIANFCGVSYETLVSDKTAFERYKGNQEIQDLITKIQGWTSQANQFKAYYNQKDTQIQQQANRREEIKKLWEELLEEKDKLNYNFYQKYSKYIQEGSWISEDYMDDNLYYLDAENVLYTSAFPEISYTIDVLELSQLEGYENYKFSVGDKTYMEDVEFFGYKIIDAVKTPYREEVILSEVTFDLDDPSSNQIKIQNYKTQFEDLFQRITATTQSLQYQTGEYNKAAGSFNTDGSLKQPVLQNSMINNSLILSNATDQSVVWDETGITVTNLAKPNEIVRIVSGGILITSDGGDTWSAGITGNGINTAYLTAGQIDAGRINIISGGFPSFRWDGNGISAYKFSIDETTQTPQYFQFNNFVRLDQYGIYGINHDSDFVANSLAEIKQYAQFGLTWDGFFLKSDHHTADASVDGRIEISTDEDFRVIDGNEKERIKIGLLGIKQNQDGSYTGHYGIRISDIHGAPVMATNDEGMLWLTKEIVIGPDNSIENNFYNYRTRLGILETWQPNEGPLAGEGTEPYSQILSVRDNSENHTENLAIYDTGKLYAREAEIHGMIYAEGGKIGNLDIESFTENLSGIEVSAESGITIKEHTDGTLSPEKMKFVPKVTGKEEPITISWSFSQDGIVYTEYKATIIGDYYDDDGNLNHGNGILEIASTDLFNRFNPGGILYLRATVDGLGYDNTVLTLLKDADMEGIDIDTYNIRLNYPEILKFFNEVDGSDVLSFVPGVINIKSYKGNEENNILSSDLINYDLYIYSNFTNYYNTDSNKWIKLTGKIKEITYNIDTDSFIDTGNLIDSPFNNYISFTSDTNYSININKFYDDSNTVVNINNYFFKTIREILLNENTVLQIKLIQKKDNKVLSIENCSINFGTSSDMATFALTASNIQMAVQEAGLIFDSEGLHIINSGFEIINKTETTNETGETVITEHKIFDVVDGSLYMEGNGTFTGTITATNGSFTGNINATSGTLENLDITGLINIGDNLLINGLSTEENPNIGIYSKDFTFDGDKGFFINNNGEIIANQLSLGAGATIKKYIKLGNTWIINPLWLNDELNSSNTDEIIKKNGLTLDSFIVVKEETVNDSEIPSDLINIKQNGIISIGKNNGIKIDGKNESISSFNYENNKKGWSINPIDAEFNNITARGSIKAVAFEYEPNTVQSVGGILLVKPSSAINSISIEEQTDIEIKLKIVTETQINFNDTDFAKIGHSQLEDNLFLASNTEDVNTLIVTIPKNLLPDNFDYDILIGSPILNMGGVTSPTIVINGSESDALYPKSSLSIFENNISNTNGYKINPQTKLVLGQMPKSVTDKTYGIFSSTSYGLYAENVFLKGALISEGKNKNNDLLYSGMNTNSTVEFNDLDKQYFDEAGYIILWAGAKQTSDGNSIDIQNARFKVDNFGNLYANSGYFVGTIITDATITASKIKTAEIEGYQYKDEDGNIIDSIAALSIKNADVGIKFETETETIMELKTDGLILNKDLNIGNNFIVRQDSSLVVPITIFSKTRESKENITVITPNKIGFVTTENFPNSQTEYDNLQYNSYLANNEDGLSIFENNITVASYKSDSIKLKQNTKIGGQMLTFYDEQGDRIKWQTVVGSNGIIGYDLYLI